MKIGKQTLGAGLAACTLGLTLMAHSANPREHHQTPKIQVILTQCAACHNPDQRAGGLDLTSRNAAIAHGRALVPGNVDASAIAQQVVHGSMPPGKPLSPDDQDVVITWIKSGAVFPSITPPEKTANPKSWAFKPLALPVVPKLRGIAQVNPIDAFIQSGLRAKGIRPSKEADRTTLIRRVTIDVTGLPPTPAEVSAFLSDSKPGAFERVVDRLLASSQYGERYGRFWLDIA
ncbi:MAG: hypothetical protein RL169_657, partial [Armatimonadota bacterium]